MGYKADNAIIMAAGTASRFAPLSYERPKALLEVRGEVLIERQIRQLRDAGIQEIVVVVGYQKEQFRYLQEKFQVILVDNNEFDTRNNNSTIYAAREYLKNSYICSSDNYFSINPFEAEVEDGYYAALYADGQTKEWCMEADGEGYVNRVRIGGEDAWYMLGHVFWTKDFSQKFLEILLKEYDLPQTADKLWEAIYMEHLDQLKLKIRKYQDSDIFEFDTLDELREFDASYVNDARSRILKQISRELGCHESEIVNLVTCKDRDNLAVGFRFCVGADTYQYTYKEARWRML